MIMVTIAGNLGGDAETKEIGANGDTVTKFRLAATKKDSTTWFSCALFGKRGAAVAPFLKKGTSVSVVGELSLHLYDSKEGKAISADVRVSELALQGGPKASAPGASNGPDPWDA